MIYEPVEFPAVTFCNLNSIMKSRLSLGGEDLQNVVDSAQQAYAAESGDRQKRSASKQHLKNKIMVEKVHADSVKDMTDKKNQNVKRMHHTKKNPDVERMQHTKQNQNVERMQHTKKNQNVERMQHTKKNQNDERMQHTKQNQIVERMQHTKKNQNDERMQHTKQNQIVKRMQHTKKKIHASAEQTYDGVTQMKKQLAIEQFDVFHKAWKLSQANIRAGQKQTHKAKNVSDEEDYGNRRKKPSAPVHIGSRHKRTTCE